MKTLILPVKRKWFDQIKAGTKTAEYRLRTDYWRSRLVGKEYDLVVITLGYPPREDTSRRLTFEWNGYDHETVTSEEWGNRPREVYAIRLDSPRPNQNEG